MATKHSSSIREQFINNISVGNIVAFRSNSGMYSAKVIEVRDANKPLVVQTKNGSILYVAAFHRNYNQTINLLVEKEFNILPLCFFILI